MGLVRSQRIGLVSTLMIGLAPSLAWAQSREESFLVGAGSTRAAANAPTFGYVRIEFQSLAGPLPRVKIGEHGGTESFVAPGLHPIEIESPIADTFRYRVLFSASRDEREPNDDPRQAAEVSIDAPIRFEFPTRDDRDWFRISVPGSGTVQLLAVKDDGRDLGLDADWYAVEETNRLGSGYVARVHGPTTLLVRIAPMYSTETGHVIFRFHPDHDPHEPNDLPFLADRIELGRWNLVSLASPKDLDYFTVEMPETGYLTVDFDRVPSELAPMLDVVDSNGAVLSEGTAHRLPAGAHRVRLFDKYRRWSGRSFLLRLAFVPEQDEREGHEKEPISFDRPYRLTFTNPSDRDTLPFRINRAGYVRFRLLSGDEDPELRIVDANRDSSWGLDPGRAHLLRAGSYRAELSPSYRFQPFPFRIVASFVAEQDENEFETDSLAARSFSDFPMRTMWRLFPEGDEDRALLRLPRPGLLRITQRNEPGNMPPPLELHVRDSLGEIVPEINQPSSETGGLDKVYVVEAGGYVLTVSSKSSTPDSVALWLDLLVVRSRQLVRDTGTVIAFVSLGDPDDNRWAQAMAHQSDVLFVSVDSLDPAAIERHLEAALATVLTSSVQSLSETEEEQQPGRMWILLIILVVVTILIGGLLLARKRGHLLVLLTMIAAAAATSCSDAKGSWRGRLEVPATEAESWEGTFAEVGGDEIELELNGDGTFSLVMVARLEGEWSSEDDRIVLRPDSAGSHPSTTYPDLVFEYYRDSLTSVETEPGWKLVFWRFEPSEERGTDGPSPEAQ